MTDIDRMLKALRARKIETTDVYISDDPEIEDDSISLSNNLKIQVGRNYYILNLDKLETEGCIEHLGEFENANACANAIANL